MRRSSSRSDGLFGALFARGDAAVAVDDLAWLQAMLDAEAALARACASARLIPARTATDITLACRAHNFDITRLGQAAAEAGNPVVPLVTALRRRLEPETAAAVHRGATSQDILDTAMVLVSRTAVAAILADARAAADGCAILVRAHGDTVMLGRTLLQQAMPTTFAFRAAGWMNALDAAIDGLAHAQSAMPCSLGGAVGVLGALGADGPSIRSAFARELGLPEPAASWHGDRSRPAALAGALAVLSGTLAKIARDVTLLAQDEVGELREGGPAGRGGSSAMAHKDNPVGAVVILGCAARVPGLVSTIHAGMAGEHERAAGAWHAEWETLSDLLRLTGSAAAWGRELTQELEIDPVCMRANLDAALPRILGDGVTLEDTLGVAALDVTAALAEHDRRQP